MNRKLARMSRGFVKPVDIVEGIAAKVILGLSLSMK